MELWMRHGDEKIINKIQWTKGIILTEMIVYHKMGVMTSSIMYT